MLYLIRYLAKYLDLKNLISVTIILLTVLCSLLEISLFVLSAGALELFLFDTRDGLSQILTVTDNIYPINTNFLLFIGCFLAVLSIVLNFQLIHLIKNKIVDVGLKLQNSLIDEFLSLPMNFEYERNNKTAFKVFAESILVITESIILQLYLAFGRVIIVLVYGSVGLLIGGSSFIFYIALLLILFSLSFLVFAHRMSFFTEKINIFGENRLRILSNFIDGRLELRLFGFPKSFFTKIANSLKNLLHYKISVMTEVHKPRMIIEGFIIMLFISLGLVRLWFPTLILTSSEIFNFLIILRILPALQQLAGNIRAAAASTWAARDIKRFVDSNKSLPDWQNDELAWSCSLSYDHTTGKLDAIKVTGSVAGSHREFVLRSKSVNVIRGASGVGKSTLLKVILKKIQSDRNWEDSLKSSVSYLPQNPVVFLIDFVDNLVMGDECSIGNKSCVSDGFNFTKTWIDNFNSASQRDTLTVSGGEAQRIAVLRCLSHPEKDIYLFDEPTSSLDSDMKAKIASAIQEKAAQGKLVIVVTHDDLGFKDDLVRFIDL